MSKIDIIAVYRSFLATRSPAQLFVMEENLKDLMEQAKAVDDKESQRVAEDALQDVRKMQRLYKTSNAV